MEDTCPNCAILEAKIVELQSQLDELRQQLQELLGKTSKNSHQPPSQDKPGKVKSQRPKSDKPSGGQKGHKGNNLKMSPYVDEVVDIALVGHCGCGHSWSEAKAQKPNIRQVHDLPDIRLKVTAYHAEVKVCPNCHCKTHAAFPEHIRAKVQYGPRFHAVALNLTAGHLVPLKRTCEVLQDMCGASISQGTLVFNQDKAFKELEVFEDKLKQQLQQEPVLHADETGSKVSGSLFWIHVTSTKTLTLLSHHPNRGYKALQHIAVLPNFPNVLVHDAWKTYFQLPAQHALCNAHLLRELTKLSSDPTQQWAVDLHSSLQRIYHQVKAGMPKALMSEVVSEFKAQYVLLVEQGLEANPIRQRTSTSRGRVRQSFGRNLALRLQYHQDAVLRFLQDDPVPAPFDNNQAERDLRMVVVKRKISGGFRSPEGGKVFCRIRSYISTLRKQGMDLLEGLTSVFKGDVLLPQVLR